MDPDQTTATTMDPDPTPRSGIRTHRPAMILPDPGEKALQLVMGYTLVDQPGGSTSAVLIGKPAGGCSISLLVGQRVAISDL